MEVDAGWLTKDRNGVAGYLARPKRAKGTPAILMIHHSHDVSGELLQDAYDFAEMGICVLIPGLFEMAGMPRPFVPGSGREIQKQVSDPQFLTLIQCGWDYLANLDTVDAESIGVMGYCMGGRLGVHFVADEFRVKCFGTYYPSIKEEPETHLRPTHSMKSAARIRCPSFVVFGGSDRIVSNDMQIEIWKTLLNAAPSLDWHFFSHGKHGFAAPPSQGFQPDLARRARYLKFDFFRRQLLA